jgi:Ca2+-binding RTX toxin-like protein
MSSQRINGSYGDDFLKAGGGSGGSIYEVVEGSFSWEDARANAESRGGHLATITSEEEWNAIVQSLGATLNYSATWLGATDSLEEGNWEWITGEAWGFDRWVDGEPNNSGDEDYLQWYGSPEPGEASWNDLANGYGLNYLLELETSSSGYGDYYLSGGWGDDTLQGGEGNDTLDGGDGNDLIIAGGGSGGASYEVVEGSFTWDEAKNDAESRGGHLATITSEAEWNNVQQAVGWQLADRDVWLGATDAAEEGRWEWVTGEAWDYTRWVDGQPDDAGGGSDYFYYDFESGTEVYYGDASGAEGEDYLHIWGAGDSGLGWNDLTNDNSGAGASYLLETESASLAFGNNSLFGGAGDDTLKGACGNDTLDGGAGNDLIIAGGGVVGSESYEQPEDYGSVWDETPEYDLPDYGDGGYGTDSLQLVSGNNSLSGGEGDDTLQGASGADTLDGGAGYDSLTGGGGDDAYRVDSSRDVVFEDSDAGIDVVFASASLTLGDNVENLTLTGASKINATGNELSNEITGNGAANRILGVGGDDVLSGGSGNDTLNAGTGFDTVKGGAGSDLLQIDWSRLAGASVTRSVRKVISGSSVSFSGTYTAKDGNGNVLSSVAFDGIESATLNGKAVVLDPVVNPGVTLKLSSGAAATTEQGATVKYYVVLDKAPNEKVTLNFASSDVTEGKVLTPSLTFSPSNWSTPQTLVIQGQDDYLDDGNIAYTVSAKISTSDLVYNRLTVKSINLVNNDDGEDKPLSFKGTADVDYFQGKNGNDRIYGGGDQDQLKGGRGDDRIYGENDDDRLFGEIGNDEMYGGYDDDKLDGGEGGDSLFGEQGRDTLLGGTGNDYLDGGLLNDSMSGGAGNDTYFVDSTGDIINDLGASTDVDTVLVIQTISYTLPSNIENANITANGNAGLTGNALDNRLGGNDGKNILDGGVGGDSLDGGSGADSLLGGVGDDDLIGGAGNDTLRGGAGVDLADFEAAGVDVSVNLALGRSMGDGTDTLIDIENVLSGDGDDTLTGNAFGNELRGGAGVDGLNGGNGNDTLSGCFYGKNGGLGEIDTLVGGAGADLFQLGWAGGRFYDDGNAKTPGSKDYALITDFTPGQDTLQLDGAAGGYYLADSGLGSVKGIGLFAEQGATDELIAVIRSADARVLTAANTINTAVFV